jgi:hypothetical protein
MTLAERQHIFEAQVAAAAAADDSDQRLAAILADPAADRWLQLRTVAALGDAPRGPAGTTALRSIYEIATREYATARNAARSEYCDLACASVWALAKRDGPAATDIYAAAARSASTAIRDYGMSFLALVGEDSAWDQVMVRLADILRREIDPCGMRWREACHGIEYLARHAAQDPDRAARLVGLIRERWRNLGDQDLIGRWWPGIDPDGPPASAVGLAGHTPRPPW